VLDEALIAEQKDAIGSGGLSSNISCAPHPSLLNSCDRWCDISINTQPRQNKKASQSVLIRKKTYGIHSQRILSKQQRYKIWMLNTRINIQEVMFHGYIAICFTLLCNSK
jgi:hypothetical protein